MYSDAGGSGVVFGSRGALTWGVGVVRRVGHDESGANDGEVHCR
jgi:hypothetical protein